MIFNRDGEHIDYLFSQSARLIGGLQKSLRRFFFPRDSDVKAGCPDDCRCASARRTGRRQPLVSQLDESALDYRRALFRFKQKKIFHIGDLASVGTDEDALAKEH